MGHYIAVRYTVTRYTALGLAGILGGVVLLAVFVADIPPELNPIRLVLYNAGAMAIVVGVHRRQAAAAPRLALAAAVPALLANAWYLVMVVLAAGREPPFAGDFGLGMFWAAVVMWWADAWFGLVTGRLRVVGRLGGFVLAVGSVLAFTGIDRLGLTSPANPTIFGPLALTGIALNGVGWVLLGVELLRSVELAGKDPAAPGPAYP